MVSLHLVIGCEEEDGGDDRPNLDQLGIGRLDVFDLEGFLCCLKNRGEFFRQHFVDDGLLALKVDDNQLY